MRISPRNRGFLCELGALAQTKSRNPTPPRLHEGLGTALRHSLQAVPTGHTCRREGQVTEEHTG